MNVLKYLMAVIFLAIGGFASAETVKQIKLHPADSDPVPVGILTLQEDGGYRVEWDDSKFGDFFLSMRPFKCLEGPEKLWCRVDYPYEINRDLSGDDLTDLEYDLLFVWKNANDFGINMWNGIYYELEPSGAGFQGALYEFDMDTLAAPPEDGSLRPITEDILDEGDPDSHWLPRITIE
jgi:hypothetical protein